MTAPSFFGYGSLVNLATHDFDRPRPATLQGWRRVWRHTTRRELAILSVERTPDVLLSGIVADVPGADWTALDRREAAYRRQPLTETLSIYEITDGIIAPPGGPYPILLSYVDVVTQGLLQVYGEPEARDFFATTAGWGAPILNDRAAPIYPRAQRLSRAQTAFVDNALAGLSAQVQELHQAGLALER